MAGSRICSYCGSPVGMGGYCTSCRLNQKFLKKAGNTSLYYYNIGLERAKVHDLTGAMGALSMSLRYNKTNVNSRNLLGLIYYEMGEIVTAMSHWVISVNYDSTDNPAVKYLKELRNNPRTLEESDEIARGFNTALQQAINHEFDLAVIQLHKCISGNEHFVKGYLLLALIYIETKKDGMARKYLEKVLTIDKGNITALHYLGEMGESEDIVTKKVEQAPEEPVEMFNYYGIEEEKGRPARKIIPERGERKRVRIRNSREESMVKYANLYMFAGIVIGALVFYFLIAPGIRRSYIDKINEMDRTYSSTLASRNSEVENLISLVDSNNDRISSFEMKEEEYKKQIDKQKEEIEKLKAAVEEGGGSVVVDVDEPEDVADGEDGEDSEQDRSGVGHNIGQVDNAAAERNNANIRGISKTDVEALIQGE